MPAPCDRSDARAQAKPTTSRLGNAREEDPTEQTKTQNHRGGDGPGQEKKVKPRKRETVFLDTDIFVMDLRYPADRNFRSNRGLLNVIQNQTVSGVTSIYNVLEVCGILSFNLSGSELIQLYAGLAERYAVHVLFPSNENESICFLLEKVFDHIRRRMSFGDALIADIVESEAETRIDLFLSWNAKHFAGKISLEAITPAQFLKTMAE